MKLANFKKLLQLGTAWEMSHKNTGFEDLCIRNEMNFKKYTIHLTKEKLEKLHEIGIYPSEVPYVFSKRKFLQELISFLKNEGAKDEEQFNRLKDEFIDSYITYYGEALAVLDEMAGEEELDDALSSLSSENYDDYLSFAQALASETLAKIATDITFEDLDAKEVEYANK